jgi:hypothetical protein
MSEQVTLEGLRREWRKKENNVFDTLTVSLCADELKSWAERFWQIVDGMEHQKYFDVDLLEHQCLETCVKCALEKLGGERR